MPDMPLNRMYRNAQALRHRLGVEPIRHQVKYVELARSELRHKFVVLHSLGVNSFLAGDRLGEQRDRDEQLTASGPANGYHDLICSRRFRQVGRGAGVDRVEKI